jgi:hypothetical protein
MFSAIHCMQIDTHMLQGETLEGLRRMLLLVLLQVLARCVKHVVHEYSG